MLAIQHENYDVKSENVIRYIKETASDALKEMATADIQIHFSSVSQNKIQDIETATFYSLIRKHSNDITDRDSNILQLKLSQHDDKSSPIQDITEYRNNYI